MTLIPIDEFKKLKRDDMFVKLAASAPDLVKGKTRAKKEELVEIYETLLKQTELSNEVIDEVIAEEKDVHTQAAEEAFKTGVPTLDEAMKEGLARGELAAVMADPKHHGSVNVGALQNTPLRTEEAKELRDAFAEPLAVPADFTEIETRIAASMMSVEMSDKEKQVAQAMGLGGLAQASMDAYDREKPYGGGLPKNTAVLSGHEHVVGVTGDRSMVTDAPVGVVVSRRAQVERELAKLKHPQLVLIATYKHVPKNGNRRQRKLAESLLKRVRKFLPKGITIDEAMAVLP